MHGLFATVATAFDQWPFLIVPPLPEREYHPDGFLLSYGDALTEVQRLRELYRSAGYGVGHRVAFLVEQRPEYVLHWLALNGLGAGVVPLNALASDTELLGVLADSRPDLVVAADAFVARTARLPRSSGHAPVVVPLSSCSSALPEPSRPALEDAVGPGTEAALLYTSGSTGRPKGCILTNEYFAVSAYSFLANCAHGAAQIDTARERLYCPFPFHHGACTCLTMSMIASGNCMVLADRFHARRFWKDVVTTEATIMCYFAVVPPALLSLPESPEERQHHLKFGHGAGAHPEMRRAFERRFGVPLFEFWAMTETGRGFEANELPLDYEHRAVGRPRGSLDVRLVDAAGLDVPAGAPGRLLVRAPGARPRRGFFAGYLGDAHATDAAWEHGWFHTGDILQQLPDGSLRFVDRAKNIIRRSGENIAALEVESVLQAHPDVRQVAVIAVDDHLHEEEVLACVVLGPDHPPDMAAARSLHEWCAERLAYYKVPAYVLFVAQLPTTHTQKVEKTRIFPAGSDPRARPDCLDLRALKGDRRRKR